MDSEPRADGEGGLVSDGPAHGEVDPSITGRVVLAAVGGGLVGILAMTPLLIGIPQLLGVFRAQPIVDFASIGLVVGLEPSLVLGVAIFVLAGTVVLPLLFIVAVTFLPPQEPRNVRGVTFATMMWAGFVLAFWPAGDWITVLLFLLFSLLSHWVYGFVLGTTVERLVGIPEHDV